MPSAGGVISNAGSSLGNVGVGQSVGNLFTGNLDFQRNEYLFNKQVAANNAAAESDRQFAARQNELTRAFNAAEAEKARAFEQKQSETQYLRAAEQLKKLGINPAVLAFGGSAGSAASMAGTAASAYGSSGGSHHVSGSSWSRFTANGFSDLMRLIGTIANSAAISFRALSFMG